MNPYSIPPLISSSLFLFLGLFALVKSKKHASLTLPFFLTTFVTFWWQFSWFILFNTGSAELANIIVRVGYSGITFIPITFFHFYSSHIQEKRNRKWIIIYYGFAAIFLMLLWTSDLYIQGFYSYFWGFYPKAGILHPVFLFYLVGVASHSFYSLIRTGMKVRWQGVLADQIKYLILSFFIYCFAASDFVVNYGIEFYPAGFFPILVCLVLVAHAIVRYRLLDIKLAITRAGVFISVYTVVLGLPFGIGLKYLGSGSWLIPCFLMAVLATIGPFVYLYLQKRTEQQMLIEQHQYQATLRRASLGMGRIKDLKHLLNLIVHILVRTVRLEHCSIYLLHKDSKQYTLKAFKSNSGHLLQDSVFSSDSALVKHLETVKEPVLCSELKKKAEDMRNQDWRLVVGIMEKIEVELIVPCFIEEKMLAFVMFGKKLKGKIYSEDDLVVFSILANQSALAIENAQFYEDMKKTHEQLFKAEKMATIGTMADGLSHQINNRLHAMGFIAGDALDSIKLKKEKISSDSKELLDEIQHALERIEDNVKRGGEIVEGLLKYTRKGEEGFSAVNLDQLVNASIEMVQFKIKIKEIDIIKNYNGVPQIYGNFTQLQEVFFNLIDNAYDAMMQRKTELHENNYRGQLDISAFVKEEKMEIVFHDNGIGVRNEDQEKIFTPFFTTKLSSKKGTGLGLYVIRQIIEENHKGVVRFSSEYRLGSQMEITLPIYRESQRAQKTT
jgi:signal transduction histidine kinase